MADLQDASDLAKALREHTIKQDPSLQRYSRIIDEAFGARFVLISEATHGTSELTFGSGL